ncbi:bifunctional folylpolyglutamate synthase/dihydrofolate synthase [Candidatus Woesearchaeota archaeon]|nr:bifunctional folylpolyglutamate synthase/dihydrofolate synthase [Candidatus Woesearchaeota archaeon]
MNYKEAINYLYTREKFGIKLGLENINELLEKLDNPQNKYKTIHVAGTNGKGSVCAILTQILIDNGYKVGTYNSPHLIDFEERIRINNIPIKKTELAKLTTKIKPKITNHTFFEVTTALAFKYFEEQKIDIGIIEVGMGGRLDATNTIIPEISIITNISLEHTEHLGDKIEKITYEKAGIIKPNVPVVTGTKDIALKVIKLISKKRKSKLYTPKESNLKTSLLGKFQKQNLSLAIEAIKILQKKGFKINRINDSLQKVKWPGRMQKYENILFDCAHNPDGVKKLTEELKQIKYKNLILVTGIMKDKDITHMIKPLEKLANKTILTQPKLPRAAKTSELKSFLDKDSIQIPNVKKAIEKAKFLAKKDDLILITGSIFTIGEAFEALGIKPFTTSKEKTSFK